MWIVEKEAELSLSLSFSVQLSSHLIQRGLLPTSHKNMCIEGNDSFHSLGHKADPRLSLSLSLFLSPTELSSNQKNSPYIFPKNLCMKLTVFIVSSHKADLTFTCCWMSLQCFLSYCIYQGSAARTTENIDRIPVERGAQRDYRKAFSAMQVALFFLFSFFCLIHGSWFGHTLVL